MKAIFVDLDCLISVSNKAWIIDKSKPNVPIMKISKEDFNLFKNGIFKSQGNRIDFNGKTFWLPTQIFQKLKVKLKNYDSSLANLAISMQEFMNKELIENLDTNINHEFIELLKNKIDDIYIILSKQTKNNYAKIIEKLENIFEQEAIIIKNYYFISETFYNQNEDQILFKKARLFLQHLVGYKTDDKKFTDEELLRYDKIIVYDNNPQIIKLKDEINSLLKSILSNTKDSMVRIIKENIDDYKPSLEFNYYTDNSVNRFIMNKVILDYSNLIRSFENFKNS